MEDWLRLTGAFEVLGFKPIEVVGQLVGLSDVMFVFWVPLTFFTLIPIITGVNQPRISWYSSPGKPLF